MFYYLLFKQDWNEDNEEDNDSTVHLTLQRIELKTKLNRTRINRNFIAHYGGISDNYNINYNMI